MAKTCEECGFQMEDNAPSCPNCGCPNDDYQPQQEMQTREEPEPDGVEDDFNEGRRYSPFSSSSWFFSDPWPLKNYPRTALRREHPFWGWFFGPWHLTCRRQDEEEEYAVINNVFYFFNLVLKVHLYSALWAFFKAFWIIVVFIVAVMAAGYMLPYRSIPIAVIILQIAFLIPMVIIACCGLGKALHRYWPSIHRTWRRLNKRYWDAMKK